MKISKELLKVKIVSENENEKPKFVKTALVEAEREDGVKISWEINKGHDSIHILVDNIENKTLELVAQVRIPVKLNNPETDGICFEACAGLVDKDIPNIQIAKEELLEEMGYDIPIDEIIPLRTFCSNVGQNGNNRHTYTCNVNNSQKVNEGGGLDFENIAVVSIPYVDVINFLQNKGEYKNVFTDSTTLFMVQNWLTDVILNSLFDDIVDD